MTTMFPVSGAFVHYASRFCDPALGKLFPSLSLLSAVMFKTHSESLSNRFRSRMELLGIMYVDFCSFDDFHCKNSLFVSNPSYRGNDFSSRGRCSGTRTRLLARSSRSSRCRVVDRFLDRYRFFQLPRCSCIRRGEFFLPSISSHVSEKLMSGEGTYTG